MYICNLFRSVTQFEYHLLKTVKKQYIANRSYAVALRSKKKKAPSRAKDFIDTRVIRAVAGCGGTGCISFLHLFANANAGPDGGDGGCGGHVIFEANNGIRGLNHINPIVQAASGQKGFSKDCHGRNANHTVVQVPVGTVFKNESGRVVADLHEERMMFLAARGGAGGKGNHFFCSESQPVPRIAEVGAEGESIVYTIELSSMAHFGLLGFPNAGKSTLLQAITRANPKVASYPFTTLKPHLGVIQFSDLEQITIADLPGIIEGSHQNKGLGITFLRHAERCMGLLILLDMSNPDPWESLKILRHEVLCFSSELCRRPQIVVANKMDCEGSEENLEELRKQAKNDIIISISAKHGYNLTELLSEIKKIYDTQMSVRQKQIESDTSSSIHFIG